METIIITFQLDGITEAAYAALCEEIAPTFAAVDGLHAKVWLADRTTNTYGSVYTFESAADVDRFMSSQLFADIGAHPNLAGFSVQRFQTLDEPTRITRGSLAVRS